MGESAKWYRVKPSYPKPAGGFLVIGPRYPGVLSDDGLVALFTHPGDAQWTEVVDVEHLEEAPEEPDRRPPRVAPAKARRRSCVVSARGRPTRLCASSVRAACGLWWPLRAPRRAPPRPGFVHRSRQEARGNSRPTRGRLRPSAAPSVAYAAFWASRWAPTNWRTSRRARSPRGTARA